MNRISYLLLNYKVKRSPHLIIIISPPDMKNMWHENRQHVKNQRLVEKDSAENPLFLLL